MIPASRTELIQEYYFARKLEEIHLLESQGKKIINLGIGSPDMEPHKNVTEALRKGSFVAGAYRYKGYKGIPGLKEGMAEWYKSTYNVNLDPSSAILPLIGSKEAIGFISLAYLEKGDKVLIPNPGYPTYSSGANIAGGEAVYYNLKKDNNWYPDFEELEKLVDKQVKMIWVNYPNMPTGQNTSSEIFEKLVLFAKKHSILICNDNPYSLTLNEDPKSILSCPGAEEVAIELNSLSKSHNLAGARIGMLAGSPKLLNAVFKIQSNFSSGMFQPLQVAAIEALKLGQEWYNSLNKEYQKRKETGRKIFDLIGCSYNKDDVGMFLWGKVPPTYDLGEKLADELLYKADVFITPGLIFGSNGNQYLRISLCSPVEDLEEALIRIKKLNV